MLPNTNCILYKEKTNNFSNVITFSLAFSGPWFAPHVRREIGNLLYRKNFLIYKNKYRHVEPLVS